MGLQMVSTVSMVWEVWGWLQQAYHHRLAGVYKNLCDEEALILGKEHNMAAETQLASTFYDDVN